MTLLFPSFLEPPSSYSLAACKTNVAISLDNFVLIYKITKNTFSFEFSIEIPDLLSPKLLFTDLNYCNELLLAVYNSNNLIIVNIDKRKTIASFNINCELLLWDCLNERSLYLCNSDGLLQHITLNLSDNEPPSYTQKWNHKLDEKVVKMELLPYSLNSLFVLSKNGNLYHFSRATNFKLPKLIRSISVQDDDEPIVDISLTYSDFLLFITKHSINLYHTGNFKTITMATTGKYTLLERAFVLRNSHHKILTLTSSRVLCIWDFDSNTANLELNQKQFPFSTHSQEIIDTLVTTNNGFLLLSEKSRLCELSLFDNGIVVNRLMQLPIIGLPNTVSSVDKRTAFVNTNGDLQIMENGNISRLVRLSKSVIGLACPELSNLIYITEDEIVSVDSTGRSTIILRSSVLNVPFREIKESGGWIAVLAGAERILVFSAADPHKYDLFFFDGLEFFAIAGDSLGFFLAHSESKKSIEVVDRSRTEIASFKVAPAEFSSLIFGNDGISILTKSGSLVGQKQTVTIGVNTGSVFHSRSSSVAVSFPTSVKVFKVENGLRETHSFCESDTTVFGFDGLTISLMTKSSAVKQISLANSNVTPILRRLEWPPSPFCGIAKTLEVEAAILGNTVPPPEEVSEIRFFLGLPQRPAKGCADRLYRSAFMATLGVATDPGPILECARVWERSMRFINAAVMYHYAGDKESAARCLGLMRLQKLEAAYCELNEMRAEMKTAVASYALGIASKGDTISAASILLEIGEAHAALHVLYKSKEFARMRALVGELETTPEVCTLPESIFDGGVIPLSEILRLSK